MHRNRPSVRSRESSSSISIDNRGKVKECCRKTVAFMCTQVGVGGLIVVYALVGALSFKSIETNANLTNNNHIDLVNSMRKNCSQQLWMKSEVYNIFNMSQFKKEVNLTLKGYQQQMVDVIKMGWNGKTPAEVWSLPAALMYCLSVFSMIGYGNMTPRTEWGKFTTVVYATFGIPLYILYFMNIGKVLAKTFRWFYTWIKECSTDPIDIEIEDGSIHAKKKIIVPSTACLWVMSFYILIGTLMFAHWESWGYLDSVYFCVTSLCKIGFGDYVPGTSSNRTIVLLGLTINNETNQNQTKLVINFVYMLLGMGLVAMCYNLMREDVRVKMKEVKEDMMLCLEDLRLRFSRCCGNKDLEFDD
ncbi:hypothetical protein HA402_002157 [Bradysia odoriphaga]|nr:hypothetical protein HA402_002157 [Bradysia odoriphaga]